MIDVPYNEEYDQMIENAVNECLQIILIRLGRIDKRNISQPNEWTILGRKPKISDNSFMIF